MQQFADTLDENIKFDQISDFYYTIDASTNPPICQRYRVYTVNDVHAFYYEKRDGDHWPLTESDISSSGQTDLTEEQWTAFCRCIEGGKVSKRSDDADSGRSGPWFFIYWEGDKGVNQVFEFRDLDARYDFRKWC